MAVKRYINDEWITVSGLQGPTGATGATGQSGIHIGNSAPTSTDVLWLDTDEPENISSVIPYQSFNAAGLIWNCLGNVSESANATITANVTYFNPFFVKNIYSFDRISIRAGSGFSGTATIRLGIYSDNGGQPGNLVLDAGTISATASGVIYSATINQQLGPGMYYLAANVQSAAATNTFYTTGTSAAHVLHGMVGALNTSLNSPGFQQTGVTGAFANVNTANLSRGSAFRMTARTA